MANKNLFTKISLTRPNSNVFDLTHDVKLSFGMGKLIPIMCMEAVPGDKFSIGMESLIRFAPLIAPIMHRLDVTTHYFFVPNRILWDGWEDFITGNTLQGPAGPQPERVAPYMNMNNVYTTVGSLPNYLGVGELGTGFQQINALPFAAYQAIYNEYYRDQNLIPAVPYKIADGNNDGLWGHLGTLRKRAWGHDYFTSALPWAQKGEAVDIPIGPYGDVPVKIQPPVDYPIPGSIITNGGAQPNLTVPADTPNWEDVSNQSSMFAQTSDLSADPTTINDLRRAFKLQEWLEKNARAGTRYIENILAHFGVKSSDKRMQRPEYITGVKSPVVISEVLNTTGEDGGLPQGNMAGHAVSVTSGKQGSYFCEEHGFIIGIMSVLPQTAYQQGIPKQFQKFDRLDYYWPSFAHIGEQEIKIKELYAKAADPELTFGYTPRYSEYKYWPSRVAGLMQTTLNYWQMARIFSSEPALNPTFIEANPTDRVFAVQDGSDTLIAHVLNRVKAVRRMPYFGNPQF